jgi:hypothetical protein
MIPDLVKAVTDYVARRLIERERALDEDPDFMTRVARPQAPCVRRRRRRGWGAFVLGFLVGARSRSCSPPCWRPATSEV